MAETAPGLAATSAVVETPVAAPAPQVEISLKIDGAAVERILRTTNHTASVILTLGESEVQVLMLPNGQVTITTMIKGRITCAQTFYGKSDDTL